MMDANWLSILFAETFCEVMAFDAATLRLIRWNDAARNKLHYSNEALDDLSLASVIADAPAVEKLLRSIAGQQERITLDASLIRSDGSCYAVELRVIYCDGSDRPVFLTIGNDVSLRREAAEALRFSESRFRAIVSNTPGLVYQFVRRANGSTAFPYLSEGCHALLGMLPDQLRAEPELFIARIVDDDRSSFLDTMTSSATDLTGWNWEGRMWIDAWNDIKWINLRAMPRMLDNGDVQWEGIMTNITQSRLEQAELERSRAQLAEWSAHVEKVKEEERKRIAREIHDDLGGNLTAIKMALALLARRLPGDSPELIDKAAYLDTLVDRTIDSIHRIAGNLRPSVLDIGIVDAIEWQGKEFSVQLGIECVFAATVQEIELAPEQSTALFRMFQESLTNVGKHAQADRVDVNLSVNDGILCLDIADNGRGIDQKKRVGKKSFGIVGMRERANALGGTVRTYNAPDGGCVVAIRIPLAAATRAPLPI